MLSLPFYLLPHATESAAANMADDLLMLEQFPDRAALRFRHYSWRRPAFTFGYSQPYAWARREAGDFGVELCRRATGGGLVDHRNDWTYSLVIPPQHELYRGPVEDVYRIVHATLGETLEAFGLPVALASPPANREGEIDSERGFRLPGVCFDIPERADLVAAATRKKVAGAALKRNRFGLLLQGSIDRSAAPTGFSWDALRPAFAQILATRLQVDGDCRPTDFPAGIPDPRAKMTAKFASPEWIQRR
jgi:lipoate-protein ligase A